MKTTKQNALSCTWGKSKRFRPYLLLVSCQAALLVSTAGWAAEPGISQEQLLNMRCSIPSLGDGPPDEVQFKNGQCSWGENKGQILSTAVGDLNHDGIADGAIVYGYNSGGSGFFTALIVFLKNKGKIVQLDEITLGDRSSPQKLSIKNNKVNLDILAHKESDPASKPSWQRKLTYTVKGETLVGPDDVR